MLKIGLTGGIGSGKTTISKLFKGLNVPIVDTDLIAREVVLPGRQGYCLAIAHFGAQILDREGGIDRKKLRDIIFSNPQEKIWLEQALHPLILEETLNQLKLIKAPYCIIIIPLLAENPGVRQYIDRVLVIDTTEANQIERTKKRDQISTETALAILKTQASRKERLAIADDIITNNGDINELKNVVQELHKKFTALSHKSLN